jgi:glycosyltransferase involved in cell wall biosynthesis
MRPETGGEAQPAGTVANEAELRARLAAAEAQAEALRSKVDSSESLASAVARQSEELGRVERELAEMQAELVALRSNRLLRVSKRLRNGVSRSRALARGAMSRVPPTGAEEPTPTDPSMAFPEDRRYPEWVALYDTIDDDARSAIRRRLDALSATPLVSVILPVYNTPETYLREALDSIRAQLYPNWELCIADDCSTAAWVPKVLDEYAALDPRIKVEYRTENGHISAASNTALAMATGPWVALFDHDDLMAEHALALSVLALDRIPGAGILYSDEDHVDDDGLRSSPYFKPDFDPVLLLGQNYFSHLSVLRRDLIEEVGGYRAGLEGSQDWDLVLRVVERLSPEQVVHVPHVLYHWRSHPGSTAFSTAAKPYAAVAARRAVQDHLDRTGKLGRALPIGGSGFNRIHWELPDEPPSVSVVVLARTPSRLPRCLDSVRMRTTYPAPELVVVDDGDRRPPLRAYLHDRSHTLKVVRDERDVSDAALRNAGARAASGEVLCFVSDDVEVEAHDWLEEMVGLLLQPGIGAVGAKLLYPTGSVEHAGIVLGIGGTVGHVHRYTDRLEPGYFGRAMLSECFSAVSWACMVVRREAFEAVGGFDEEHLSGGYADVDLCLRLGEAGWRTGWTPFAELVHHQPAQKPPEARTESNLQLAREVRYLHRRWGSVLEQDPAYNPNLSLAHETFPLAWPPRASYR